MADLNSILKQRGLMSLDEYDEIMQNQSFISTGYKEIDDIICPDSGGFPRGSLSEICGMSRCISGDAKISFRSTTFKTNNTKKIKLKDLYKRFHNRPYASYKPRPETIFVRSVDENSNTLTWSEVENVIYSGQKPCLRVNGEITATAEHRFWTPDGWRELRDLKVGDKIARIPHNTYSRKSRHEKEVFVKYHPDANIKIINGCRYYRLTIYRLIYEAGLNGLSPDDYRYLLNNYDGRELKTVEKGMCVHHKNGDHGDNSLDNLMAMPIGEHTKIHGIREKYATFVPIAKIEQVGLRDVYDIVCKGNHSFTADNYIVHNCGKSRFVRDVCMRPEVKALYIDTENSLSTKEYNWMKEHGVDVIAEQLLENIWGVVNDAIDADLYDLIVVDSIGATDTQAERDDDNTLSMSTNVQRAKIMSKWLRGIGAHFMKHQKTALVFVNHLKEAVSGYGHQMAKPCGKSIDFHCMVQLQCSGADSSIAKTKKDFNVVCKKTRYNIVGQKAHIRIDLDPYKNKE